MAFGIRKNSLCSRNRPLSAGGIFQNPSKMGNTAHFNPCTGRLIYGVLIVERRRRIGPAVLATAPECNPDHLFHSIFIFLFHIFLVYEKERNALDILGGILKRCWISGNTGLDRNEFGATSRRAGETSLRSEDFR